MKIEPNNTHIPDSDDFRHDRSALECSKVLHCKSPSRIQPRNGEKQLLDIDEPVEFENNQSKFRNLGG